MYFKFTLTDGRVFVSIASDMMEALGKAVCRYDVKAIEAITEEEYNARAGVSPDDA